MNINNHTIFSRISLLLISLLFTAYSKSQSLDKVDAYVKSLGSLDTLNMGSIAHLITQKFNDKKEKARAIFIWITDHIAYETKINKANDPKSNTSDMVLKTRKAGSLGYATLFQDMCSAANIRCLTADGFFKRNTEHIDEKDTETNHTWAIVQLGQSPDEWYYVDAACGSGILDKKGTTFTKSLEDAYFFANKTIFNLQHYPSNTHWQLGNGPRNKKSFYALPIVKNGAYRFNATNFIPTDGLIKIKAGKTINFSFSVLGNINKVSLLIQENKKQQNKIIQNPTIISGKVKFDYIFENEGMYEVSIFINDEEILQYLVEVQ